MPTTRDVNRVRVREFHRFDADEIITTLFSFVVFSKMDSYYGINFYISDIVSSSLVTNWLQCKYISI